MLNWRSAGPGFDSHPLCCRLRPSTSRSHTHMSISPINIECYERKDGDAPKLRS